MRLKMKDIFLCGFKFKFCFKGRSNNCVLNSLKIDKYCLKKTLANPLRLPVLEAVLVFSKNTELASAFDVIMTQRREFTV